MTGYVDGFRDDLRDVASLCEAIEKQAGKTNAEARADTVASAVSASSHRGSSQ